MLRTADLVFRSRLEAIVRESGGTIVATAESASLAIVELFQDSHIEECAALVEGGCRVLAFGAHVHAARLREARRVGAPAVTNMQLEDRLRDLLASG